MVSVIIPIFNVEDYLESCLQSIITQTYQNLEIILIDDGSIDRSSEICDQWKSKDSRIKVIHKTNGGLSSARNTGIDIAKGKYIVFVDSDDVIKNNMIECLRNHLETDNQIDLSVCGIETFNDDDINYRKPFLRIPEGLYTDNEYLSLILSKKVDNAVWNKMYRADTLSSLRFKEGIINEDFPFIVELLTKSKKICYVSEPLYFYRMRKGSITRTGINKRCYDYVKNALWFKSSMASKFHGLKTKNIETYIHSEMIGYLGTLAKNSDNVELSFEQNKYKDISQLELKKHFFKILLNKRIPFKQRVKLILLFTIPNVLRKYSF